jgi:hypothetical protein
VCHSPLSCPRTQWCGQVLRRTGAPIFAAESISVSLTQYWLSRKLVPLATCRGHPARLLDLVGPNLSHLILCQKYENKRDYHHPLGVHGKLPT